MLVNLAHEEITPIYHYQLYASEQFISLHIRIRIIANPLSVETNIFPVDGSIYPLEQGTTFTDSKYRQDMFTSF